MSRGDREPVPCASPCSSSSSSSSSSDEAVSHVEDEMLKRLMKKSCKLYDELQEEKRITEDAKLRVCLLLLCSFHEKLSHVLFHQLDDYRRQLKTIGSD